MPLVQVPSVSLEDRKATAVLWRSLVETIAVKNASKIAVGQKYSH